MGRRSERLSRTGQCGTEGGSERDVIQVVSRAFDILRCFEGHEVRLGNLDIASRCSLPRSTVSRLTHTLTRMGQLVYLPHDQKYRLGPGALAMSTSMARGLQFRGLIRRHLQDVADRFPGVIGFVVPDRFHMVYLEYASTEYAVGLDCSTGTRLSIARTAAGHAYVAALDVPAAEALLADMERELPAEAADLRPWMAPDRQSLHENGYVVSCKLWSPRIHGIATPLWSAKYRTFLVISVGVLSTMYDEARLHHDVAPALLALREEVAHILESADGAPLINARAGRLSPQQRPRHASSAVG
jgi:DNA-binding IclR family transcriptional regulator